MSKRKQWVTAFAIFFLAGIADNWSDSPDVCKDGDHLPHTDVWMHTCADTTHALCDGECECDGQECPTE